MTQTIREQLQALAHDIEFGVEQDISSIRSRIREILATEPPAVTVHGIQNEWMRAIGKAASALRFTANEEDGYTEAARAELLKISQQLTELETHLIKCRVPAVTVRNGWIAKDANGLAWFKEEPKYAGYGSWYPCDPDSNYINDIDGIITDPWPDKPNGGPECVMEVG